MHACTGLTLGPRHGVPVAAPLQRLPSPRGVAPRSELGPGEHHVLEACAAAVGLALIAARRGPGVVERQPGLAVAHDRGARGWETRGRLVAAVCPAKNNRRKGDAR